MLCFLAGHDDKIAVALQVDRHGAYIEVSRTHSEAHDTGTAESVPADASAFLNASAPIILEITLGGRANLAKGVDAGFGEGEGDGEGFGGGAGAGVCPGLVWAWARVWPRA